jgi:hypothetical protein
MEKRRDDREAKRWDWGKIRFMMARAYARAQNGSEWPLFDEMLAEDQHSIVDYFALRPPPAA